MVLYLSIYLEGCSIGSMKQELIDIVFASLVVFLSLSLSPIDCIWVEGLALEGRSGKALST